MDFYRYEFGNQPKTNFFFEFLCMLKFMDSFH